MQRARLARVAATAAVVGSLVLAVGLVLLVVPSGSYIFLPDRAHPVAPLVSVKGGHDPKGPGGIYFVDVFVRKATLLEKLWPGIRSGASLHPASDVNPPGVSESARRTADLREMTRSQQVAAAVAERALGLPVKANPAGALIDAVAADGPAVRKLLPTDVVVAVDGKPVRTPDDLRRLVGVHEPGTVATVAVRRGKDTREFRLRTAADPRQSGRPIIGVLVEQNAEIKLPVAVRINSGDVGGPSAGLAFALDVMAELGRDVTHGRRVAATGAIELNGRVAPIGGVEQKTLGARQSRVDVFLVPAGDNAAEARKHADGLRIVPVRTFQQALRALATVRS